MAQECLTIKGALERKAADWTKEKDHEKYCVTSALSAFYCNHSLQWLQIIVGNLGYKLNTLQIDKLLDFPLLTVHLLFPISLTAHRLLYPLPPQDKSLSTLYLRNNINSSWTILRVIFRLAELHRKICVCVLCFVCLFVLANLDQLINIIIINNI